MKKFIKFIAILILIIVLIILYARCIGTRGLKVNEYKVESTITSSYHGLKIVQLSDIHYGSTIFEQELSNIVDRVNLLKPDVLVLTGDLIDDNNPYDKDILIKYLSQINVTIGKYAVSGNHDIIDDYNNILESSGFKNLDNSSMIKIFDSNIFSLLRSSIKIILIISEDKISFASLINGFTNNNFLFP